MATLKQAYREAITTVPKNVLIFFTLEFIHPLLADTFRIVNDYENQVFTVPRFDYDADTGELEATGIAEDLTFTALPFQLTFPSVDDTSRPAAGVKVDTVNKEIMQVMEITMSHETPVSVIHRPYLSTDRTAPQIETAKTDILELAEVSINAFAMTSRLQFPIDFANRKFPKDTYTIQAFPGLVA